MDQKYPRLAMEPLICPTLARGMRDVRDLPMITDAMLRRGYSEERIDKFWGGNLLRVFRQVTQNRG
jgi:membrane dipeptidase